MNVRYPDAEDDETSPSEDLQDASKWTTKKGCQKKRDKRVCVIVQSVSSRGELERSDSPPEVI